MRKQTVCLILVLALIFGFSAWASAAWKGTITLWDYPTWRVDGDNYHWIKERIKEFEASHPGVKIDLVEIPWSGGPEKLDIAVQSGTYPDMARGPLRVHYIERGVLEPVGRFLTEEDWQDYLPNAIKGYSMDGKLYGFPFYMTSMTILLNLDIFAERGAEPPANGEWTWDQFVETIEKLSFDRDGDGKIDVYGFAATAMPPDNQHLWPFLYSEGVELIAEDGKFGFNTEPAIKRLEELAAITTNPNLALPFAPGYGDADIFLMFKKGKVAIVPIGVWSVPAVREDVPDMNVGTVYYPVGSSGEYKNAGAVSAYYIFKQEDPEKLKVVAEFARYITSTEQQKKLHNYGTFPTRRSATGIYQDDPAMTLVEKGLDQVVFLPPLPSIDKIVDQVSRQIQMVLLGQTEAADAMRQAERKVRRFLRR